jgi:hypothetical protein
MAMPLHQPWALSLAAVALLLNTPMVAQAIANFVTVTLPRGISIELPRNWVVLSNDQRITLDTAIEARLDLSGIEQETSDLPFAANYYDDRGRVVGILNIRYYPDLNLSQAEALHRCLSPSEMRSSCSTSYDFGLWGDREPIVRYFKERRGRPQAT